MAHTTQINPIMALERRYQPLIEQARLDLRDFSGLHRDFLVDCFGAIESKKSRLSSPLLGQLFPYLASEGLKLSDGARRGLAAAWLAMYGYICLADYRLDQTGSLDARASTASAALLCWAISEVSKYTIGTPFAATFVQNVSGAFSGQYEDINNRHKEDWDRTKTDVDKNRAVLAILCGYCAASNETDDRLLCATEKLLGPFQLLDDLRDLTEDVQENNITALVKIARQTLKDLTNGSTESALYSALISDPRIIALLERATLAIGDSILLLHAQRDNALVFYLAELRKQMASLIALLRRFRSGGGVSEPDVYGAIREILCDS